jgi:hypothetical protein
MKRRKGPPLLHLLCCIATLSAAILSVAGREPWCGDGEG